MPFILDSSEIKVIDGDKNFTIETVKSNVIVNQDTVINEPVVPILQLETTVSSETIDETYKYMAFTHSGGSEDQTEYSVKFNIETECDILIVGGGGGGGCDRSGGGGSGACIVYPSFTMNGEYKIKVGKGGLRQSSTSSRGYNGNDSVISDSSIVYFNAKGGGGGASLSSSTAGDGGSGGGRTSQFTGLGGNTLDTNIVNTTQTSPTITSTYAVYGNIGGRNTASWTGNPNVLDGGGGGGIGEGGSISGSLVPVDSQYTTNYAGKGGDGLYQSTINNITYNFKNHFGAGVLESDGYYYIGGGGGGGDSGGGTTLNNGGYGGGGDGGDGGGNNGVDALENTGGGGGGGAEGVGDGGAGGSGIVIIRYKVADATMEPQTLTHYTPERMYPPIHNFTSYSHLISGESYGNGVYEVSVSTNSGGQEGFQSFNDISNDIGWSGAGNEYSSTGMYIQSNYIVPGYLGDWIKIKLPRPIKLTRYGFKQRAGSYEVRAPGTYKIYGSNDGTNWDVLVHKRSKISYTQQISESNDYFEENINVNNQYQYFALVVNELMGSVILVNFHLWYIYGKEFISEEPEYKLLTFEYQGPSYPVIDPDAVNLVAWYKFDDAQNLGKDELNQRNLVNTNAESLSGVIGDSSYFADGDYLHISNFNFNLDNTITTSGLSISLWFKLDSTSDYYGHLFMWGNHGNTEKFSLMRYNLERKLVFQLGTTMQTAFDISAYNTWINLIITIDTSRLLKVYENTVLIHQFTLTQSQYSGLTTSSPFTLGRAYNISSHDLKGNLDDFRIYDKALSATEISDLYNQYSQTSYTVNFPEETECDILIVGGGGAGADSSWVGGGGAGGLIYYKKSLTGSYKIKVGKGGGPQENPVLDDSATTATNNIIKNGSDSEILDSLDNVLFKAVGGSMGLRDANKDGLANDSTFDGGSSGGSGYPGADLNKYKIGNLSSNNVVDGTTVLILSAGGESNNNDMYDNTSFGTDANGNQYGMFGSRGGASLISQRAGGGGGAGSVGENGETGNDGVGSGGAGKDMSLIFGSNAGDDGWFAGGGGGGGKSATVISGLGGKGGGGDGNWNALAESGLSGTGGGGGASDGGIGGNGGSGIVIIRYKTQYQATTHGAQWTYHSANPNTHHYGNVGIGTVASATQKLLVNGDMNVKGNYKQNDNTIGNWYKAGTSIYRASGNVGIGNTAPQYSLHVHGGVYAGQGGTTGNGTTVWTSTSDSRMKDNIFKASYKECYDIFKKIELYRYNFKPGHVNSNDRNQLGFIAQEVQQQIPNSVEPRSIRLSSGVYIHDILTLNVTQINYILYGTFKYLIAELDIIKKHLESQEEAGQTE